jgi:hypothetical protein
MSVYAKRINGKQRAWLINYETMTTFEPIHQEEIDNGTMTFNEVAKKNIDWFESWMNDAFLAISRQVPRTEEKEIKKARR